LKDVSAKYKTPPRPELYVDLGIQFGDLIETGVAVYMFELIMTELRSVMIPERPPSILHISVILISKSAYL
jgi:hypothetical protein